MGRESILESQPPVYSHNTDTIALTTGSASVVGTSTTFTDLTIGQVIAYFNGGPTIVLYGVIASITDDTHLTLKANATVTIPSTSFYTATINTPFFIGDNTVLRRAVLEAGINSSNQILKTAGGRGAISKEEGILLKTLYVRLPFQYTMASSSFAIDLFYCDPADSTNVINTIDTIGEGDSLGFFIPIENTEIEVNAYIPPPSSGRMSYLGLTKWSIGYAIRGSETDPYASMVLEETKESVSQVNAPDELNGVVLPIYIGARIVHAETQITVS